MSVAIPNQTTIDVTITLCFRIFPLDEGLGVKFFLCKMGGGLFVLLRKEVF
jgi:hypothetical protein